MLLASTLLANLVELLALMMKMRAVGTGKSEKPRQRAI